MQTEITLSIQGAHVRLQLDDRERTSFIDLRPDEARKLAEGLVEAVFLIKAALEAV